ncbi:Adhesion G protein-coupled receptor A2 [Saguinus oedipus]|uniref:Adhesion G protein-coupled receptor A2 n=1 Tax=Saguinus oedipus TaxID=9490 RepID=A0ABQ9U9B7_SAGOE|nr:Adhesion G protein-coupled receptor A2 [Saguinus oedipus]
MGSGSRTVGAGWRGTPVQPGAEESRGLAGSEVPEKPSDNTEVAVRILPGEQGSPARERCEGLCTCLCRDLRNNVISTVQPGAFLGLGELKRLDLSNNRIGCLSSETFQGLPRLLRLDLGTEFLTCDCHLRWLLPWARNRSLQLSEHTLCAYPSALHAQALGSLQEAQLCCEGALELHTHHLIPSLRQVVFQGDRLPFQCSASYLGNDTRIHWYHNRAPVEGDEQAGILLAESLIHDCTFITSELTLSHIGLWASGEWECSVSMAQGNASKKVEIVVLETSASYCPAERIANNRGDFRWPRTLAGITAYQSCLQYPFTSVPLSGGTPGTRASRRCDRAGRWEPGDYSHCLYTNDITRVLYTFVLMPINASNALTLAHQLRVYTAEAASFSDMMDVVYVAQMIQKFLGYVDQIKEVRQLEFWRSQNARIPHLLKPLSHPSPGSQALPLPLAIPVSPQLVEVMVDMASNLMLVDEHLLWLAQREDKACSRIVGALERIGGAALSPHAQHISVVMGVSMGGGPSMQRREVPPLGNVALEAYLIKPHSYVGLTCTAFQRREGGVLGTQPGNAGQNTPPEPEPPADQQLRFRCTTGRPNISLSSFHIKNSVALASIQLPPSLFSSLPAALAPPVPPDCTLQLLVFRNGRLFRSHGNTSRPGAAGPGKRRGVATPVIFAGTTGALAPRKQTDHLQPSSYRSISPLGTSDPHTYLISAMDSIVAGISPSLAPTSPSQSIPHALTRFTFCKLHCAHQRAPSKSWAASIIRTPASLHELSGVLELRRHPLCTARRRCRPTLGSFLFLA